MNLFSRNKKCLYKMTGMVHDSGPRGTEVDFLNDKGQHVTHFIPARNLRIGEIVTVTYEKV